MRLMLLCLALWVGTAHAAHITDKLVVGLYPEAKAEGTPLQLLSSGTPLDVLKRKNGFSEVRLADGKTGWVESTYVTEEKPAKAMLLETQARLRQMGLEMARLREAAGSEAESSTDLDQDLDANAQQRIAELEAELAAQRPDGSLERLEQVNASVRRALEVLAQSQGLVVPADAPTAPSAQGFERYVLALVGLGAALVGFLAGVLFIDYRIRKRYGGFRLR
jgi:SH3 domain protein